MDNFYCKHGPPASETTGVPGWQTPHEERALIRLAQQVPLHGCIVEIGGEWGRGTSQFAAATPSTVKIFTVDKFPDNYHDMGMSLLWMHRENLRKAGVLERCVQIQKDSAVAGLEWRYGAIDLLFIDGGHGYRQVQRDIEAWVKHVAPGGVVVFHDYAKQREAHTLHHQVKLAVDEWYCDFPGMRETVPENQSGWKRHNGPDSLVWFQKPLPATTFDEVAEEAPPLAEPVPFSDVGDLATDYEADDGPSVDDLQRIAAEHSIKLGNRKKLSSILAYLRSKGVEV